MAKKKKNLKNKKIQSKPEQSFTVNSRVSRNEKLYSEDFSITKQQQFNFKELNLDTDLNLENTLDTSFIDKKPKKVNKEKSTPSKVVKKSVEIREKIKEEKPIFKEVKPKKKNNKALIFVAIISLLAVISCTTTFVYLMLNSPKEKVVNKTKTETEVEIDDNFLFLGDSITNGYDLEKYYKDMPVVNSGVGGNITEDILNDMNERVYKYNPSKVFILIGTNDISEKIEKEDTLSNVEKIIENIQENRPYCEIYLESIYPINDTDNDKISHDVVSIRTNKKIKELNEEYQKIAKKYKVTYINTYDELTDKDGNLKLKYTYEGLHISDEGYEKITKVLTKYLED